MNSEIKQIPPNFNTIIVDWTRDLSTTFPEYAYLWTKWTVEISELETRELYEYCMTVYPERFFDILYQNSELFELANTLNTCFLPGVEFKLLFNCPDISDTTHKTMWKYLQLVLFTIVGSIHDKSKFGESANMFENLDETELHNKLQDAMTSMGDFFQNLASQEENASTEQTSSDPSSSSSNSSSSSSSNSSSSPFSNMPDADDLHGHLKGLFDGKIGNLAKELAEEISGDMADILGKDGENMNNTSDILKNMMKNPSKITGLIKTVSDKLQSKMNSGEISQDELMKEAMDIMGKMKGSGGGGGMGDFQEMFKNMAKGMGGVAGMANMAGMNIPKNAKMDINAIERMTQASTLKDRMRNKMLEKKLKEEATSLAKQTALAEQAKNYKPFDFSSENVKPNKLVFKIEGDTVQETSSIKQIMDGEPSDKITDNISDKINSKKKKKKNKK